MVYLLRYLIYCYIYLHTHTHTHTHTIPSSPNNFVVNSSKYLMENILVFQRIGQMGYVIIYFKKSW